MALAVPKAPPIQTKVIFWSCFDVHDIKDGLLQETWLQTFCYLYKQISLWIILIGVTGETDINPVYI